MASFTKYKHLFFDIDRTLWDYENNAVETLKDLFILRNLAAYGIDYDNYIKEFYYWNEYYWEKFMNGNIQKETLRDDRFVKTLAALGVENKTLALQLSNDYIEISPTKTRLFPKVPETLEYLYSKYHLHIITNGFNEIQFKKLKNSGIDHFFKWVITSDIAGYRKPNRKIFEFALKCANARKNESVMIGDNWDFDIIGAKMFGIDQIYFNPEKHVKDLKPACEIYCFDELMFIL